MENYTNIASRIQQTKRYPGLDWFQTGFVSPKINTLYTACWLNDCAGAGQFSGFLTDFATVSECLDSEGSLDMNKLASMLQLEPSRYDPKTGRNKPAGEPLMVQGYVNAYDIDHLRLKKLEKGSKKERMLYRKIFNPNGLTPGVCLVKTVFGQAEENYLYDYEDVGSGTQFYILPKTFNEAAEAGVFKFNNKESYSFDGSTGKKLIRKEIPYKKYEESLAEIDEIKERTRIVNLLLNRQWKEMCAEYPPGFEEEENLKYDFPLESQ